MKDYSEENSMVCGLQFEEGYTDPYEQREVSYDEARQREIDELDDVLRSITRSLKVLKPLARKQAE